MKKEAKLMDKEEFIETFAHFMSEHDLNEAYDKHFPNLGYYSELEIREWLKEVLEEPNPPLKFEELKKGMPVWDKHSKEWIVISCVYSFFPYRICCYRFCDYWHEVIVKYQENRFYRKQVKE